MDTKIHGHTNTPAHPYMDVHRHTDTWIYIRITTPTLYLPCITVASCVTDFPIKSGCTGIPSAKGYERCFGGCNLCVVCLMSLTIFFDHSFCHYLSLDPGIFLLF